MILVIIAIIIGIYYSKPALIFKENSEPRHYGIGTDSVGDKKTLVTMEVVIILLVIIGLKKVF